MALGDSTVDGSVILAKNSDRPSNECQQIRYYPRKEHSRNSKVKCTYIEVPQAPVTNEIVLSSSWWAWGAEMGANEYGVAIGNEAEWSKEPVEKKALLGVDLLRLGLERGRTAYDAMQVIADHLVKYGQGGQAVYENELYNDNAFIIADQKEAWILETAGRYWTAKKLTNGVYALSNVYTIEEAWDKARPDVIEHAVDMGWCKSEEEFNFARSYWDFDRWDPAVCESRRLRSNDLLEEKMGEITPQYMMRILRDHYEGTGMRSRWSPNETFFTSICMHATKRNPNQTAGSFVAHIKSSLPTYWFTGSSQPCVGMFKPFYLGCMSAPNEYSTGTNKYSPDSAWWIFERLKRRVDQNYAVFAPVVQSTWRELERLEFEQSKRIEGKALDLISAGKRTAAQKILQKFINKCSECAIKQARTLHTTVEKLAETAPRHEDWRREYWNTVNTEAQLIL